MACTCALHLHDDSRSVVCGSVTGTLLPPVQSRQLARRWAVIGGQVGSNRAHGSIPFQLLHFHPTVESQPLFSTLHQLQQLPRLIIPPNLARGPNLLLRIFRGSLHSSFSQHISNQQANSKTKCKVSLLKKARALTPWHTKLCSRCITMRDWSRAYTNQRLLNQENQEIFLRCGLQGFRGFLNPRNPCRNPQ